MEHPKVAKSSFSFVDVRQTQHPVYRRQLQQQLQPVRQVEHYQQPTRPYQYWMAQELLLRLNCHLQQQRQQQVKHLQPYLMQLQLYHFYHRLLRLPLRLQQHMLIQHELTTDRKNRL